MEELTLTTPALLFSAVSLILMVLYLGVKSFVRNYIQFLQMLFVYFSYWLTYLSQIVNTSSIRLSFCIFALISMQCTTCTKKIVVHAL